MTKSKRPLNNGPREKAPTRTKLSLPGRGNALSSKATFEATDRLQAAIDALAHNPRQSGVKKLRESREYRIRVGDYRVIYSIFDAVLLVEVVKVGQRGNFYDE